MTKSPSLVFHRSSWFDGDVKRLSKKYRSLPEDLDSFCNALKLHPTSHIYIEWIGAWYIWEFYKAKKVICKSINKNSKKSGLRIIYRVFEKEKETEIELIEISLIEIYHKNTKKEFDRDRLEQYRKGSEEGDRSADTL